MQRNIIHPKVSVIVTVYNSGEFLEHCLKSLINQDLKNIEIIIVNDCSQDPRDDKIIESFIKKYNNICYVKNSENLGTGYSREIGITKSHGEYIGFLDSDDYVEPYAYSLMYKYAKLASADIAVANYKNISDWSIDTIDHSKPDVVQAEVISGKDLFESQILRINRPFYLRVDWWNKIYKRSLFIDNNITFPHVVRNEGSMSMIMSLLSKECIVIDTPVFYTTSRPTSVCRFFRVKNISDTIKSTIHFRNWLKKIGMFEKYKYFFIKFFYFIIFDHNIKLIIKLPKDERKIHCKLLMDQIYENKIVWIDFLYYINLKEKFIQRLIYSTICTNSFKWEILKLAKDTDFFERKSVERKFIYSSKNIRIQPEVTIITICKNIIEAGRKRYFDIMVESVMKQTFSRSNFEHIVIDAASDDGTVEYLSMLYLFNKIDFYLSEHDSGIYNAMNKACMLAHGKYILFLNSDDYLDTKALEKLILGININNADYAFGNAYKVDKNENKVGTHIGNINKVYFGSPYCHQTLLCKRSCFYDVYFDEKFKITMWSYALNLYLKNYKYVYIPEFIAYFRVGGVSTNQNFIIKFNAEQTKIKIEQIVSKLPITFDEYEFLNCLIRKYKTNDNDFKIEEIFQKLIKMESEFVYKFTIAMISLLPVDIKNKLANDADIKVFT
jgi:glycosyltransferase involved in cell wall biosynthesis